MNAPFPPPLTPVDTVATGWLPLATLAEVQASMPVPVSVSLAGRPWAVVVLDSEVVALRDVCPHRRVPLSAGVVAAGPRDAQVLECGYHGWSYGRDGACARIPALGEDVVPRGMGSVAVLATAVAGGLVWGCPDAGDSADGPDGPDGPRVPEVDTADVVFLAERVVDADAVVVARALGVPSTDGGGIHAGADARGPLRFALRPVSRNRCAVVPLVAVGDRTAEVAAWDQRIEALPAAPTPDSCDHER